MCHASCVKRWCTCAFGQSPTLSPKKLYSNLHACPAFSLPFAIQCSYNTVYVASTYIHVQLSPLSVELQVARTDLEAMKKQAESVSTEYDRLIEEHQKLQVRNHLYTFHNQPVGEDSILILQANDDCVHSIQTLCWHIHNETTTERPG